MDWGGWGWLLKRQQLAIKEQESLSNVCWFTRALCAGGGAKPIDDHAYGWQWLMSRNSHSVCGFYLRHHEGALSTNICSMGWPGWDSNPWDYQGCSNASLNAFGILLPSYHIVCVKGNYTDIWLNYELPGGMRPYLLCQHKVGIRRIAAGPLQRGQGIFWYKPLVTNIFGLRVFTAKQWRLALSSKSHVSLFQLNSF